MSYEAEFTSLMADTVSIAPWAGQDGYGKPSFGTAAAYTARVVGRVRMVRGFDGQEKVSTKTVYLEGSPSVGPKDRITLPDGSQPPILAVADYPDEDGPHHKVLYCG